MKTTSTLLRTGAALSALLVAACAIPTTKDPAYTEDYHVRYPNYRHLFYEPLRTTLVLH